MVDIFKLYISASNDLLLERELLTRLVTELPVTLGWQIKLSPIRDKQVDQSFLIVSDLHLLLLGMDIRAPIGFEWYVSIEAGKQPILLRKTGISRTMAAENFIRTFSKYRSWADFSNLAELRIQALKYVGSAILDRSVYYKLNPQEYELLSQFIEEITGQQEKPIQNITGEIGENSVILSRERFLPKNGVLIQKDKDNES